MTRFVWDPRKECINIRKHGVDFATAAEAFFDPKRKIFIDRQHTDREQRFFCIGTVEGKILTVRFVYRENTIRIFGAGYWGKGREYYEKEEE